MLIATRGKYACRPAEVQEYDEVFKLLTPIVSTDSSESIQRVKERKLKSLIKTYDVLVCYKGEVLIGAAVYRHYLLGIELFHLYMKPEHRVTYGSGLLNHYVVNVVGKSKEILLVSYVTSTFYKVIEPYRGDVYRITDRARRGLAKMMEGKIVWEEHSENSYHS